MHDGKKIETVFHDLQVYKRGLILEWFNGLTAHIVQRPRHPSLRVPARKMKFALIACR